MADADIDMEHDPDPIKASYDVYIKPHIYADRQVYVLQFPNRDPKQHYSAAHQALPLKMRIKPNAGMVEMDVPMNVWHNYDKDKGIKWGEAMRKSTLTKGRGSHGMPGGFGIGGAQPTGRGRGRANNEEEEITQRRLLDDYAEAVEREQVLVKQTLGGQCLPNEDTSPQYMIGTFRKNQLHLTPVDNIVQMRPQFHHIDAYMEQERFGRARDSAMPARVQEARAVHMTVKPNIDGEEETTDAMAVRISAAQSEPWRTQRYVDEDSQEAWGAYHQHLFVGSRLSAEDNEELLAKLPKLVSALDDAEYLDTISAPRDAAKLSRSKKVRAVEEDGAENDTSGTLSDPDSA